MHSFAFRSFSRELNGRMRTATTTLVSAMALTVARTWGRRPNKNEC
jgi:hypothetical protein